MPLVIIFLLNSPILISAQDVGIHFETRLSWAEIQEKAMAENKFIFIDCYATWCGPCKFMSKNIFTQKKVGDYMNAHFISVAVQMDETYGDSTWIKKWYNTAKEIKSKFSVNELPTYLFFSPDGKPVHRIIGITGNQADDFITKVENALHPSTQYYTIINDYKTRSYDSVFLLNALNEAIDATDEKNVELIGNAYVNSLKYPYTPENIKIIRRAIKSSRDQGFILFLKNFDRVIRVPEQGSEVKYTVGNIISEEEVDSLFVDPKFPIEWDKILNTIKIKYPVLPKDVEKVIYQNFEQGILVSEIRKPLYLENVPMADWNKVSEKIKIRYIGYDPAKMIAKEKPRYYDYKKMRSEQVKSSVEYGSKYGTEIDDFGLNSLSWNIFLYTSDRETLLKALTWSKSTIPDSTSKEYKEFSSTYVFMDTYANLLYKLGEKKKAIEIEKKVIAMVFNWDTKTLNTDLATLNRMEHGENTWEGRDERGEYTQKQSCHFRLLLNGRQ